MIHSQSKLVRTGSFDHSFRFEPIETVLIQF